MNDKERKAKAAAYMRRWNKKNADRVNAHRREIREPVMKGCIVCGESFRAVVNVVTCSEQCRKIRKHSIIVKAKTNYRSDPANRAKEAAYMHEKRKLKEVRERERADKKNHPEQRHLDVRRRKGLLQKFPALGENAVRSRLNLFGECCFCGSDGALTIEHLIPISRGGPHTKKNILGSCRRCNSSKHNKEWQKWFRVQPFYSATREYFIALACEAA